MAKLKLKTIEDKQRNRENKAELRKANQRRRRSALRLFIPIVLGIIAIFVLIIIGLNRYEFRYYIDEEGYAIPNDLTISALNTDAHETAPLYEFENGEAVYSLKDSRRELFLGDDRKYINSAFPVYTRDGDVLYFLDDQLTVISNNFEYIPVYEGLRLSDGITYNFDGSRSNGSDIILVDTGYGHQLAQDASVYGFTTSHKISMNTICNFGKTEINCYEFVDGNLSTYTIAVSDQNDIKIGNNTYNYLDFLKKLGLYSDPLNKNRVEETPEEVVIPHVHVKPRTKNLKPASDVFQLPQQAGAAPADTREQRVAPEPERPEYYTPEVDVDLNGIDAWVYSIDLPIKAYDPARKLYDNNVNIIVYEVKVDGDGNPIINDDGYELFEKETLTTGITSRDDEDFHDITLSILKPNTYYFVRYAFSYWDQTNVRTYVNGDIGLFQTLDYDDLNPVSFSLDDNNVDISEFSFQINDMYYSRDGFWNGMTTISSDPAVAAYTGFDKKCTEYYISRIDVEVIDIDQSDIGNVEDSDFIDSTTVQLTASDVALLRKGFKLDYWNSPNSFNPGLPYAYRIRLYDKFGHEFTNDAHAIYYMRTAKRHPTVNISVPSKFNKPSSTRVEVKWNNKDECVLSGDSKFYIVPYDQELSVDNAINLTGYFIDSNGVKISDFSGNSVLIDTTDTNVTYFVITNLSTNAHYSAFVVCDSYDDNSGTSHENEILNNTFDFTSGRLTSYGYIKYKGSYDNISASTASVHLRFDYNNNGSLFDPFLLECVSKIDLNVTNQKLGQEVQTITFTEDVLDSISLFTPGTTDIVGTYSVPVKAKLNGNVVDTTITMGITFTGDLPKLDGNDVETLWEYILATSNSSAGAVFDIELNQNVFPVGSGQSTKLVELQKTTEYKVTLKIWGQIEGSDVLAAEDITSKSSNPIKFVTLCEEPRIKWADVYIADEFIEIYSFSFYDPDKTIKESRSTTGNNSKIVITDKDTGTVLPNINLNSRAESIESPLRISGLETGHTYGLQVIANEYLNGIASKSNFVLDLEIDDSHNFLKEYEFVAKGDIHGDIYLSDLYRTYFKGSDTTTGVATESKYIGLIKNELVDPEDIITKAYVGVVEEEGPDKGNIIVNPDIENGGLENQTLEEDTGWIYDAENNKYISSITEVEVDKAYALFAKTNIVTNEILPEYLRQVDYIQASGQQYVKLGYFHNSHTQVTMTYTPLNYNDAADHYNNLFGSRSAVGATDALDFGFQTGAFNYYYLDSAYDRKQGNPTEPDPLNITDWTNDHTLTVSTNGIKLNDNENVPLFTEQQVVEKGATIGDALYEDYLFNLNTNNSPVSTCYATVRLKSFSIYEDGILIMNLIPAVTVADVSAYLTNTGVRLHSGVACLYDTVSEKVFVNSGTGEFTYPTGKTEIPTLNETQSLNGKLKQVSYIESKSCANIIDTGYKHNLNTVVDAIYRPIIHTDTPSGSTQWNALFGSRSGTLKDDTWDFGFNKDTNNYFLNTRTTDFNAILPVEESNDFVTLRVTKSAFSVDGHSVSTNIDYIGDSTYNDYIFGINNIYGAAGGTNIHPGWFQLKYFKISENDVAIREYIPVVTNEAITAADHLKVSKGGTITADASLNAGIAGLYDVVNNVFYIDVREKNFDYPGNGSATETIPSEYNLRQIKSITSTGSQIIDTGLSAGYGYDADIDFSFTSLPGSTTYAQIVGTHGHSSADKNNKDGNSGWHCSYIRTYGSYLRIGYQNGDYGNFAIANGVKYNVKWANYDFAYKTNKREAAYLIVNGVEGWNGADTQDQSKPAYNVQCNIGVFGNIVPNADTNSSLSYYYTQYASYTLYGLRINAAKSTNPNDGVYKRNFIPAISTGTVPGDHVSKNGKIYGQDVPAGTVGLYDTINGIFYINSGSGSFNYSDFDSEDATISNDSDSGTFTIRLYKYNPNNTPKLNTTELDSVKSDLAGNGNLFSIDKDYYNLTDDDKVYVQVEIEGVGEEFKINNVYFEDYDTGRMSETNLIDIEHSAILKDYMYEKDGTRVEKEGYAVTSNYTAVLPDSIYYLQGTNIYNHSSYDYTSRLVPEAQTLSNLGATNRSANLTIVFYNSNKEYIGSSLVGSQGALFKTPASAAYARFSLRGDVDVAEGLPDEDRDTSNDFVEDHEAFTITEGNYKYKKVEYVASDRTHWIDTGYYPTKNTRWELEYEFMNPTISNGQIGAGLNSGNTATETSPRFKIWVVNGGASFALGGTLKDVRYPVADGMHRFVLDAHSGEAIIDDSNHVAQFTSDELSALNFDVRSNSATLTFFAIEAVNNIYQYSHTAKLYSSKIKEWNSSTDSYDLKHDYEPVVRVEIDGDGNEIQGSEVYGIYDLVEDEFLMSEIEKSFIGGPELGSTIEDANTHEIFEKVEYIESHGGQAIDLGFYPTKETHGMVDFELLANQTEGANIYQAFVGSYWSSNSFLINNQSNLLCFHANGTYLPKAPVIGARYQAGFGGDGQYYDVKIDQDNNGVFEQEYGYDWRFELYNNLSVTTPGTVETFKGKTPSAVKYYSDYQDSSSGIVNVLNNNTGGKISTWVYVESDCNIPTNCQIDDNGYVYARYADGSFLGGGSAPYGNGKNVVWSAYVPITFEFKAGWNEVVVCYREISGGDSVKFSPRLSTFSQITKRKSTRPEDATLPEVGDGYTNDAVGYMDNASLSFERNLYLGGLNLRELSLSSNDNAVPSKYYSYAKYYGAEVYIDDTNKVEYIPVKNSQGEYGLYGYYYENNAGTWTVNNSKSRFYPRASTQTKLTGGSVLPEKDIYVPIDYIEADGKQYIDTTVYPNLEVYPTAGIKTIVDFMPTVATGSRTILGCGWNGNDYLIDYQSNKYYSHGPGTNMGAVAANVRHTFEKTTTYAKIDTKTFNNADSLANTGKRTVKLLGLGPNDHNAIGRLYSCQIKDISHSDALIRDFVPVRRMRDGAVGLWDKVYGRFYPNLGGGEFTGASGYGEGEIAVGVDYHVSSLGNEYRRDEYEPYVVFVPEYSGYYTFESKNIVSGDPYLAIYEKDGDSYNILTDEEGNQAHNDDGAGMHNFYLEWYLEGNKTYYIKATTSSIILKNEFEYDFTIYDSVNLFDFNNIGLYLYDAANLEELHALFEAEIRQDNGILAGGEIKVRLYRTQDPITQSINLDDYEDWIIYNDNLYTLPNQYKDPIESDDEKINIPIADTDDVVGDTIVSGYGYKAELYVKRHGRQTYIFIDDTNFIATQPSYFIDNISSLRAVANDMGGYYICRHDIPNTDNESVYFDDGKVIDFTVSDDIFTGIVDWQGHDITLSSSKPLFENLGSESIIKNGNIIYEGSYDDAQYEQFANPVYLDYPNGDPSPFIKLEYIESTGLQSIVLKDVIQKQTTNLEFEFERTTKETSAQNIVGFESANNNFYIRTATNTTMAYAVVNARTYRISNLDLNKRVKYSISGQQFTIDDGQVHTVPINKSAFTVDNPVTVFSSSINGANFAYGKLYSLKVYDNDTLVFEGIPAITTKRVVNGTVVQGEENVAIEVGTVGLYDTVSGKFFTSNVNCLYPKVPYSDDNTLITNWLDKLLPTEPDAEEVSTYQLKNIPLNSYYDMTGYDLDSRTRVDASAHIHPNNTKAIVDSVGSSLTLPSRYMQVSYLQGDGKAFINTRYKYTGGTMYTKFNLVDVTASNFQTAAGGLSNSSGSSRDQDYLIIQEQWFNNYYGTGIVTYSGHIAVYNLATRSIFRDVPKSGDKEVWLWNEGTTTKQILHSFTDDKIQASTKGGANTTAYTLMLFADYNYNNTYNELDKMVVNPTKVRIYSFYVMDENGDLALNFVPVITTETVPGSETAHGYDVPRGTYGMYDTVSGKLFINESTDASSQFTGPAAFADYEVDSSKVNSNSACLAVDNYGTITNMVMHLHPTYPSTYAMAQSSAGFVVNNYGTIEKFALQFDDGNVSVKNDVAGIALHNYGTIENGYVVGGEIPYEEKEMNDSSNYYGFVHKYNPTSRVTAVKFKNSSDVLSNVYIYQSNNNEDTSDAGYISYITSHNHPNANVNNVYVVNDLRIQSASASSGQFGAWNGSTTRIDDNIYALEYLESTGAQYIDTGYVPSNNTEIELDWEPTRLEDLQAVTGTYWGGNAMLLDIQKSSTYGDARYFIHDYGYEIVDKPTVGKRDKIHYGAYADLDTINAKKAYTWQIALYNGQVPDANKYVTPSYFEGKTPDSVRYMTDKRLSNAWTITNYYGAKCTTYLYSSNLSDTPVDIKVKTDDQGSVTFNGTTVKNLDVNVETAVTLTFIPGWNKLEVCYRENAGGDGALVTLSDTTKRLDDLSFITQRSPVDPNSNTRFAVQSDSLGNASSSLKIFGLGVRQPDDPYDVNYYYAYGKLYGYKIYERENGVLRLVHSFVPAVASDYLDGTRTSTGSPVARGTAGLYDEVASFDTEGNAIHLFYPNLGEDVFRSSSTMDDTARNTDYSALICGYNEGKVSDVFSAGDIFDIQYNDKNELASSVIMRRIGPALGACINSKENTNVNYISLRGYQYFNNTSDASYMHSFNSNSELASLYDPIWHEGILGKDGENFSINSSVEANFYPQVIINSSISSSKLPSTRLPNAQLSVRIVGSEVRYSGKEEIFESGATIRKQVALVTLLLSNPSKLSFTDISVVDSSNIPLYTEILSQGESGDNYRVDLLIKYENKEPSSSVMPKAESQYLVYEYKSNQNTVRPLSFNNNTNEKYVDVEFYREIENSQDWIDNLSGLSRGPIYENYRLTNNISFLNSTDYHDWVVYSTFHGIFDGGVYNTEKVELTNYDGELLGRSIYVDKELTDMYIISNVGNVDKNGNYLAGRGMGDLNPSSYSYQNVNSYRGCLFASLNGTIKNTIFSDFNTVYFNDSTNMTAKTQSFNDVTSAICGVVAIANYGSTLNNCHVRNSAFNTRGYGGALVGYANNAVIKYCSAINSTVTGRTLIKASTPTYLGGLVGYASNVQFNGSFVANSSINADNAQYIVGTGGIAGVVDSTSFYSCYAAGGTVSSYGNCTGGIVGKVGENANINRNEFAYSTSIDSCWTTIGVQASGDFVSGIAGYMGIYSGAVENEKANKLINSYTGSTVISTSYSSVNVNRINSFTYENPNYYFNNYAFVNQVMNYKNENGNQYNTYQFGPLAELNGATRLLDRDSLADRATWTGEVGLKDDDYNFDSLASGFMPKLINKDDNNALVIDQPDVKLSGDEVARLVVREYENREQDEMLVVKFELYNYNWNQDLFKSYANEDKRLSGSTAWYDLANWNNFTCVGARTRAGESTGSNPYASVEPYLTDDGGLVFQARFDYGDEELGHYTDTYLVTLPVYVNEPIYPSRETTTAYALIALDEGNVAAKNIQDADDWDEFFDVNGPHYNVPENIRLYPENASDSSSGQGGDYHFTESGKHAFNATIDRLYIGHSDQAIINIEAGRDVSKVVFSGNVDYSYIDTDRLNAESVSFINNIKTSASGITFNDFHLNFNKHNSQSPVGVISMVDGELSDFKFNNVSITGANSSYVGLIGRANSSSEFIDFTLNNIDINTTYINNSNVGYGGFIGHILGDSSSSVVIKNVTANDISINTSNGKNRNVGGLFGVSSYASISNVTIGHGLENTLATSEEYVLYDSLKNKGLQQLEYVESTNAVNDSGYTMSNASASNAGATIDTGVKVDADSTKVTVDFVPVKSSGSWTTVVGVRDINSKGNKFSLWIGSSGNRFYASFGTGGDAYPSNATSITYGDRYVATLDAATGINVIHKNTNQTVATYNANVPTGRVPGNNITLLGVNDGRDDEDLANAPGTYTPTWQRLYGATIEQGGSIIRNFVPCMTSEDVVLNVSRKGVITNGVAVSKGTVGLYDTVNDVFYVTANNDINANYYDAPLLAGPKVTYEDIATSLDKNRVIYNSIDGLEYVGGLASKIDHVTVDNVTVDHMHVTGTGNYVAGLIAYDTYSIIKNINSADEMVVGSGGSNVAGLISYGNSTDDFYSIFGGDQYIYPTFTNMFVSGYGEVGGLFALTEGISFPIDYLTMDNINILAQYHNVGGIFSHRKTNPNTLTFYNAKLSNFNISNGNASTTIAGQYWGGITGDEDNNNGLEFIQCDFDNFNIRGDGRVGGLVGRLYSGSYSANTKYGITLEKTTLDNFNIKGLRWRDNNVTNDYAYYGGIVGLARNTEVLTIGDTHMNNFTIEGGFKTGGIVGGNFYDGYHSHSIQYRIGGVDTRIDENTGETISNERLEINNMKIIAYGQLVGGVLGGWTTSDGTIYDVGYRCDRHSCIQNINMNSLEIDMKSEDSWVGGLAGSVSRVYNCTVGKLDQAAGQVDASGNIIRNPAIRGASDNPSVWIHGNMIDRVGGVAGILGTNNYGNYVSDNIRVNNVLIELNTTKTSSNYKKFIGGIAGTFFTGTLQNSTVEYTTVDGYDCVGGLAGFTGLAGMGNNAYNNPGNYNERFSYVNNCQVNDCIVAAYNPNLTTSSRVGGIIGLKRNQGTISNSSINNTAIFGGRYVGGILGINDFVTLYGRNHPTITNCGVYDSIVMGLDGYTGGIVGHITNHHTVISDCYVTNGIDQPKVSIGNNYNPSFVESINKLQDYPGNPDVRRNSFKYAYTTFAGNNDINFKNGNYYNYSTYILLFPNPGGTLESNSLGGIVGNFGGNYVSDCFVDSNALVSAYHDTNVKTSTGGIIGYLTPLDDYKNYDVIEYVDSDETQYISTQITSKSNMKLVIDFAPLDWNTSEASGTWTTVVGTRSGTSRYSLWINSTQKQFYASFGTPGDAYLTNAATVTLGERYVATLDAASGINVVKQADGTSMGYINRTVTAFPTDITLFGVKNGADNLSYLPAKQRIYGVQIYEGSALTYNFVPVRRKSDGTLGLYETINKTFYSSNTTTPFTTGTIEDSTATPESPADGKKLISTPVLLNSIVKADIRTFGAVTDNPSAGIINEATGGFIGCYAPIQMYGFAQENVNVSSTDCYAIATGRDYNSVQGPDPLNIYNLLFAGNLMATTNADVGVGLVQVKRPSTAMYSHLVGGDFETYKEGDDSVTTHAYFNNPLGGTPSYTSDMVPETISRSLVTYPIKYNATMGEMIIPHDVAGSNETIGLREAGLGRLRIAEGSKIITTNTEGGAVNDTIVNYYGITSVFDTLSIPDSLTKHIEALKVITLSNDLYYGDAEGGSMELNRTHWSRLLSGAVTANRPMLRSFLSAPAQKLADVEPLVENMKVYASGVDTINIEFDRIPDGSFTYEIESPNGNINGSWINGQRVATFNYDFAGDLSITLTGSNTASKTVGYNKFTSTVMTYGDSYWYLKNGQVISADRHTDNSEVEFIHMYDGKLLDNMGNIYDAKSGTIIGEVHALSADEAPKALWSGVVDSDGQTYVVNTYYGYSMSNAVNVEGRIYVKNNTLVTLSAPDEIVSGPVVDTYSQNTYATVLLDNGTLLDLGTPLSYPNGFNNKNIKEISNTVNYSGRIVLVRYEDDTLVAFNYITGEEVSVEYEQPSISESLGNFILNSFKNLSLRRNSANAEGSVNNAAKYASNISQDQSYLNALKNVTENIEKEKGTAKVESTDVNLNPEVVATTSEEKEQAIKSGEMAEGSEIVESDVDGIKKENKEDKLPEEDEMKLYKVENSYAALYNAKEDKSEIFEVSEILSKNEEERISEEEKAATLEKLGYKTMIPAHEQVSHNNLNGVFLILAILFSLIALVVFMFYIRRKDFAEEK